MRYHRHKLFLCVLCLLLTSGVLPGAAAAQQQILLDKPVRAGELIVFPSLSDDSVYYYVPDKSRLATDDRGRPQFSFLRYVENVRSGAAEEENREGEGGGIVHAVVSLSISDEQLRDAQRQLRRIKPGGRIEGPVVFKSGTFGLVSSFTDTEGNLSAQVVGLGNAPLLDGEKAAVSMQLTKLGAKILWESFQTTTPDISFSFEMNIDGYMPPRRALIEADFDQVYEHQAFAASVASTYLAGEVKGAFDDLRRQGAIRLTQIGEDEDLESLISTAYTKITEMMFMPAGGSGTPSLANLTAGAGGQQPSLLDRATELLRHNRAEAREENQGIRERNAARRRAASEEAAARANAEDAETAAGAAEERASSLEQQAERAARRAEQLRTAAEGLESGDSESAATFRQAARGAEQQAVSLRRMAEEARSEATEASSTVEPARAEAERLSQELEAKATAPAFAVVASYEMRRVRQRGTFRIDLNKYTTDSFTHRFVENIGDLRRYIGDQEHFRQVNLDDPLYRQREVVAFIDGLNAADFGEYINFVTVYMSKQHEAGAETIDEIRIDRNNFNREGNNFKLLYGWKGDSDTNRQQWMRYRYKADWSFFGGEAIAQPWQETTSGAINLAPPYQRREVTLEADPELLADAGARSVTVKLYYQLGATEKVKQVTLNVGRDQLSERIEIMLPATEFDYEYEISWRLRGNRRVSSGRRQSSESILFVDELPEE